MSTLAANDQENFVHSLQAAGAAKPLNAGVKGFGAKTPANKAPKTPFKVALNDENAIFKGGKSVLKNNGKGNENVSLAGKKSAKLDENAFVTPAGPRNRAPLGMKTTNAKAKAFQTPAPHSASAKPQKTSPRLRRPKVKVHQPEPEVHSESEDDVPEVEYMPPKEVPLPDDMDDYLPSDWKFPMLEGKNMTRGMENAYHNPIEDDGRTRGQREFEEGLMKDRKKRDEEFDRVFEEQMAKDTAELHRHFGVEEPKKKDAVPKSTVTKTQPLRRKEQGPSTIKAKSAAQALSPVPKPSYAAPTATTKSRIPGNLISSKKSTNPPMFPSATRHASAAAASKSTIGYARGRATATGPSSRKPLSNVTKPAPFSTTAPSTSRPRSATTNSAPLHSRAPSTTSTVRSKPREPFSRCSSTSTNATLVTPSTVQQQDGQQQQQYYRTAEDLEREMELLLLQNSEEDDGEDADAWARNFQSQLGGGGVSGEDPLEEELEGFQLQVPEGL